LIALLWVAGTRPLGNWAYPPKFWKFTGSIQNLATWLHNWSTLKSSSRFTQKDVDDTEIIVFQNWQITNCVYRAV